MLHSIFTQKSEFQFGCFSWNTSQVRFPTLKVEDSSPPISWLSKMAAPSVNSKWLIHPFVHKEICWERKSRLPTAFCLSFTFTLFESCRSTTFFSRSRLYSDKAVAILFSDIATGTLKHRLLFSALNSELNGTQQKPQWRGGVFGNVHQRRSLSSTLWPTKNSNITACLTVEAHYLTHSTSVRLF